MLSLRELRPPVNVLPNMFLLVLVLLEPLSNFFWRVMWVLRIPSVLLRLVLLASCLSLPCPCLMLLDFVYPMKPLTVS